MPLVNATDDDRELLTDKDLKVLTVGEMGLLLDQVRSGQRPDDPQPPAMTVKAMEYAARFATNKNRDTLVKMREMLAKHHLTEVELGLVANLSVETADEARKLVPTLDDHERFTDEQLDSMLKELATYREFD